MTFREVFERECIENRVSVCASCGLNASHKRGFACVKNRTIHIDRAFSTRSTLLRGLHEIGHIVTYKPGMKRWERELEAETFAQLKLRFYGYSVPKSHRENLKKYILRMKRWGGSISKGRER